MFLGIPLGRIWEFLGPWVAGWRYESQWYQHIGIQVWEISLSFNFHLSLWMLRTCYDSLLRCRPCREHAGGTPLVLVLVDVCFSHAQSAVFCTMYRRRLCCSIVYCSSVLDLGPLLQNASNFFCLRYGDRLPSFLMTLLSAPAIHNKRCFMRRLRPCRAGSDVPW